MADGYDRFENEGSGGGSFVMGLLTGTVLGAGLETRQVAPAMIRVNAILDDVRDVTSKVREETVRVDHAIHTTIGRIDDTAERMRWNVREKTSRVVGFIRGLRVALESVMATRHHA